ncbi:MAG: hypothetical protein V3V35_02145 [Dehalococcoidia bacterium]
MSAGARMVVEHFSRMVAPDGGVIELLGIEANTLRVRYTPGVNEECPTCVVDPLDLRELMKEALELHDPSITKVELETAPFPDPSPSR